MANIPWEDTFAVGNPEIDGHHQQFLKMLNIFFDESARGMSADSRSALLKALHSLVIFHSRLEEHWMKDMRYPGLQAHMKEHEELISRLNSELVAADPDDESLIQYLVNWTDHHFRTCNAAVMLHQPA